MDAFTIGFLQKEASNLLWGLGGLGAGAGLGIGGKALYDYMTAPKPEPEPEQRPEQQLAQEIYIDPSYFYSPYQDYQTDNLMGYYGGSDFSSEPLYYYG